MTTEGKPLLTAYYGIRRVTDQTRWWHEEGGLEGDSLYCVHQITLDKPCAKCLHVDLRPIVCERCQKGPHDDGFPPILSALEAIDLGWSRTATGLLDEECAGEIASYDDERGPE